MKSKRWNVSNSYVLNESDQVVAILPTDSLLEDEKIISSAPELLEAVQDLLAKSNKGIFRPKATIDKFKNILDKHNI